MIKSEISTDFKPEVITGYEEFVRSQRTKKIKIQKNAAEYYLYDFKQQYDEFKHDPNLSGEMVIYVRVDFDDTEKSKEAIRVFLSEEQKWPEGSFDIKTSDEFRTVKIILTAQT